MDRFHEIQNVEELSSCQQGSDLELWLPKENVWGHDIAMLTMLYLILLTLWFHKDFKLIFAKSSSWPKTIYVEHLRKLAWATF